MTFDPSGMYVPRHELDAERARAEVAEERCRALALEAHSYLSQLGECLGTVERAEERARNYDLCAKYAATEWGESERRIESLEARIAALVGMLRDLEWSQRAWADDPECPICGGSYDYGHAPDCELAALLEEA